MGEFPKSTMSRKKKGWLILLAVSIIGRVSSDGSGHQEEESSGDILNLEGSGDRISEDTYSVLINGDVETELYDEPFRERNLNYIFEEFDEQEIGNKSLSQGIKNSENTISDTQTTVYVTTEEVDFVHEDQTLEIDTKVPEATDENI